MEARSMNPALIILFVLLIGVVVGLGAVRIVRPSWLTPKLAGGRRAELTSALVGIAGAFIGFHAAALFALSTVVLLVGAAVGAILVVWVWREVRV
jgi:uncharacterized membrane protein YeaQ/YmgE (transglycosylase-associated protein family)